MEIWIYLIIGIVLSLIFVPRLTTGGKENNISKPELPRDMQPVISQTGVIQAARDQILPADPTAVPGKKTKVWPADDLHYFDNTEIVPKLCGPGITAGSLLNWKKAEEYWQTEYSDERLNTDMKRVKPTDESADMRANSTHSAAANNYYHNPAGYCNTNPEIYPCPNYWMESGKTKAPSSGDMLIPGLAVGQFRKPSQLEDKVSINVVNRRGPCY
jgi:hypothetical protein